MYNGGKGERVQYLEYYLITTFFHKVKYISSYSVTVLDDNIFHYVCLVRLMYVFGDLQSLQPTCTETILV